MADDPMYLAHSYNWALVALSIGIAIYVSFILTAVSFRVARLPLNYAIRWIVGGSVGLGIGIWSMHFVGMLAFSLPIPLNYDVTLTLVSVVPAIIASMAAFTMVRLKRTFVGYGSASVFIAAGIVAMHYTGMAALQMAPAIHYEPVRFTLSILCAFAAASGALLLVSYQLQQNKSHFIIKLACAVTMGMAISSMHYVGMAAAQFEVGTMSLANDGTHMDKTMLLIVVVCITVLVLFGVQMLALLDKSGSERSFYQAVFNAQSLLGEAVLVIENDEIVFANVGLRQILGYEEDQPITYAHWLEAFPTPEGSDSLHEWIVANRKMRDAPVEQTVEIHSDQDETKFIHIAMSAFAYRGQVRQLVVMRDISEQIEAQRALLVKQAENRKLANVAKYTDNVVVITDAQGYVEWVNEAFTRVTEYRADEIVGKKPGPILQGSKTDVSAAKQLSDAILNGQPCEVSLLNYTKTGREYWIEITLKPLLDEHMKVKQFIAIQRDITEKKQAEAMLQQLNESLEDRIVERTSEVESQRRFLSTIFDTSASSIFLLDAEFRIVRFNKTVEDLSNLKFEQCDDKPFWEYLTEPNERARVQSTYKSLTPKRNFQVEFPMVTKDGIREYSWNNGRIKNEEGVVEFLVMVGSDVTERKITEDSLKMAYEELSNSIIKLKETQDELVHSQNMASLGNLVAGISHEINTPIGIAVTSASTINETVRLTRRKYDNGEMKKSDLDDCFAQTEKGSAILLQNLSRASELIASFKQVAVDQSSDALRQVNLHHYIDEIVTSMRPRLKKTRINIVNDVPADMQGLTHPGAIYQVLSNLIGNSLVHAYGEDDPGTINVTARMKNDLVELTYKDDGRGIPSEIKGRVFEPFFTTKRGTGGSGLGLNIVYNLVNTTLKGRIDVRSEEGQGSQFTITMPLNLEETVNER